MVSTKGGIAWPNVKCWFDPPPPNVCDIFRQKCVNHFWEWKCLIGVVKWSILGNKGTQCYPKGPYYRDRVLIRTFLAFWVPIGSFFYIRVPIFSVLASFTRRLIYGHLAIEPCATNRAQRCVPVPPVWMKGKKLVSKPWLWRSSISMSEIKSANNLCSFFLQSVLIRIYILPQSRSFQTAFNLWSTDFFNFNIWMFQ